VDQRGDQRRERQREPFMIFVIGDRPVGQADHADRAAVQAQRDAEEGRHGRVARRLPDPMRIMRRIVEPDRPILDHHPAEQVRAQRDDPVLGVEPGRGVEPFDRDDLELVDGPGLRPRPDQTDEAEL
jgi:hypothetical protein